MAEDEHQNSSSLCKMDSLFKKFAELVLISYFCSLVFSRGGPMPAELSEYNKNIFVSYKY